MPPMPPNPNNKQQAPGGRNAALVNAEKPKNARKTLGRLLAYIGRSKYLFFGLLAIMLAITLLGLAAPYIQQIAIDCITLDDSKLSVNTDKLIKTLIALGVVYLANSLFSYMQGIFSAKLSQRTVSTMRRDLFGDLVKLPIKYFDTHKHGDIMSRMTNDVENISNTISQSIGSLISGVLTVIGSIVIMLTYSPLLTLISLSTVVLTILVSAKMTKFMRKYFLQQQIILGKLNGHVEEMVTGYRTVVSYSKEQDAVRDFNQMSDELRKTGIRAQICGGVMGPLMNCISNFGFVMIAAFGGWFSFRGWITVGTIQAFILYSKQFSRPINEIANQYANIQTAIAGAERIFEVMETKPEPDEGKSEMTADDVRGDICFKDIKFGYEPEKPVLKGLDLDIKQGQKIAIVGATGSGKTTIVNLLTRFYETDGGLITVDGVDIRDIKKDELRKSVAIVLQDTVLFKGSIEDNIRYGKEDAPDEAVRRAAHHANADEFIRRLPEGYKTQLSEGGSNLSQGQRQLLSIARAVLADPKILILDEATSSVDTRTEMHIQSAMVALMKNRTSLIIAHRLSTIRDADVIVVIDGGKVAESGRHEDLIAQKGCYYDLYQTQFAGNKT
ncbi:ABC transporter ATP-binding protein [Ruminococcus sp.]|uniref:ABC transporter ATP-binding protein n=1 Tax=Ruminococcus sp. TaxID=41978 RepID=UPI0025E3BE6A|nr:ABC transporter ATP-binding protein [Ruminococcus sp.]MBQ8967473.1 ABC transporter ATP-binding protein [Ruminococcus sp.]